VWAKFTTTMDAKVPSTATVDVIPLATMDDAADIGDMLLLHHSRKPGQGIFRGILAINVVSVKTS
jgi:hypothetical protein